VTALLELDGVCAGYGGVPVVRGVDLQVDEGRIVALLGPNGAGKTTTLLAVSGLVAPTAGTIRVLGGPRSARSRRATVGRRARAGLAHVPEDRSLFPGLTVDEHLTLGVGWREGRAARARGVELFPALGELLGRSAGLLSGGEQQMLAIARALVSRPAVVMVDELSLGLAPRIVGDLLAVLRRVADDEGTGFLLVEQHVAMVLDVANHGVVLNRGEVRLSAPAAELRDDAEVLAAAYLG
jgi:branched-chain amino acid transport system ATP-binding protein